MSECRTAAYDTMTMYDTSHRSYHREVVYDSCRTLSECRSCRSVGAVGVSDLCRTCVGDYVGSVGPGLKSGHDLLRVHRPLNVLN